MQGKANKKVGTIQIEATVYNAKDAKELLSDLETLSDKYELVIDLMIQKDPQAFCTPTQ